MQSMGDVIESLRTRIAKLESELVRESAHTANEKLRADQMATQHNKFRD